MKYWSQWFQRLQLKDHKDKENARKTCMYDRQQNLFYFCETTLQCQTKCKQKSTGSRTRIVYVDYAVLQSFR